MYSDISALPFTLKNKTKLKYTQKHRTIKLLLYLSLWNETKTKIIVKRERHKIGRTETVHTSIELMHHDHNNRKQINQNNDCGYCSQ